MTRNTIATFILIVLASCKIEGNFAGLYSYYGKAKQANAALFVETDTATAVCDLIHSGEPKVYLINGRQLKECVSDADEALVYIWKPKCSSQFCYSLNWLQNYCDSVGQELFIVAEYYDAETMGLRYNIKHPTFGINTNYYNTDRTSKYISRFLGDLIGNGKKQGSLLRFKNGVFVGAAYSLE